MSNLNQSYWDALERVFIYIKKISIKDSIYIRGHINFISYIDSDWAGNIINRKLINNNIFLMQGSLISWRFKRQTLIILLSTEAEYIAASETVKKVLYLRFTLNIFFLIEKQIQTVLLKEDNVSCIFIGSNSKLH